MLCRAAYVICLLCWVMPLSHAVSLEVGESVTISGASDRDHVVSVLEIPSLDRATITVDDVEYSVTAGDLVEANNLHLFINDVTYSSKPGASNRVTVNEFTQVTTDVANDVGYVVSLDGHQYPLLFRVTDLQSAQITLAGTTRDVTGPSLLVFPDLELYVADILFSEKPGAVVGFRIGIATGVIRPASDTKFPIEKPDACKDSDGLDYYTLGSASGLHWVEGTGWAHATKTDYCWDARSDQPVPAGRHVVDFNCKLGPSAATHLVGTVFACPHGCEEGACVVHPNGPDSPDVDPGVDLGEIDNPNFDCGGCQVDSRCYPLGYRKSGTYCDDTGFSAQVAAGGSCENGFECSSHVCVSGECIPDSMIRRFIEWFVQLFGR